MPTTKAMPGSAAASLSGVEAALAVAEQAETGGVDVRPATQIVQRGTAVSSQVLDGGGRVVAAAAADAPIVVAQHGHAG